MPVRTLHEMGARASAEQLVKAHQEYLDERAVDLEQIVKLCERLASCRASDSGEKNRTQPVRTQQPETLDRGLLVRASKLEFA